MNQPQNGIPSISFKPNYKTIKGLLIELIENPETSPESRDLATVQLQAINSYFNF